MYALSVYNEGALGGIRISGDRYACGSVEITIQDLLAVDGFSTFWAAKEHQYCIVCGLNKEKKRILTPSLRNGRFLARWQLAHLHTEFRSEFALRLLEDGLEFP